MLATILIVDDEARLANQLAKLLSRRGYQVSVALDGREARLRMDELDPDVVLMDRRLPDADGSELVGELKEQHTGTEFIIITAHGSIKSAVESTRRGATDYLVKPFEPDELIHAIEKALKDKALNEEIRLLRQRGGTSSRRARQHDEQYLSRAMAETYSLARRAAMQDGNVLLLGESGTGKDFLARWIHDHSGRSDGPFFSINCAALTRDLAESELFGHEPGAFTGTRGRKRGMLELAEGGTLVLNEVGELDLRLQSKLLSFFDTKSFLRVGSERHVSVDTRIIAATNRDLVDEVQRGTFRQDLYYRLDVFPITMPSLRDRLEDLPLLVEELLDKLVADLGLSRRPILTDEALEVMRRHTWPGNVRELRNTLERSLMRGSGDEIGPDCINVGSQRRVWRVEVPFPETGGIDEVLRDAERRLVEEALRRSSSKQEAAKLLGISRHSLAYRMKTLELGA